MRYGFRSNSSTELASYKLINEILNALNNKIFVGGTFCDLKKAFDVSVMIFNYLNWDFKE
jgi:hypothetical protein